jgi:hypothetical protein
LKNTTLQNFLFLIIIFLSLSVLSCKGTKGGSTASLKKRSTSYLLKKVQQNRVEADWLDAKAKLDFDSDEFSIGATAYIRMKKDSAIWIVGKKFGIEGVRALITKDSVYYLNRLESEYMIKDISFLQKQFNLPINFYDLQDILLGNAVLLSEAGLLESSKDSTHYLLKEKDEKSEVKSYVINGQNFYPEEMFFKQGTNRRTARLEFGDHRPMEGTNKFSYFRALQFISPETGTISLDLKFSKVDLNTPKSLTFDIPSHYTKVD